MSNNTMTDEQMRIKIAEACGWIHHHMRPSETERLQKKWYYLSDLPDYLNDLNAMHEAEKTFADDDVIAEKYWLALYDATEHTRWPYDATARQRCIAFLKTKGIIP